MQRSALFALLGSLFVSLPARADFIDHFADNTDVGQMKVPRRGAAPVLVIPVIIDDQPFEAPFTSEQAFLADLRQFFTPGLPSGTSFAGFYEIASQGRYTPEPVVAAPVHFATCPTLGSYSGCTIPRDGGLSSGDLTGAVDLLRDTVRFIGEILTCAKDGPGSGRTCTSGGGVRFPDFDHLGRSASPDQFADGVILVSNGPFPGITLPVKWLANNAILRFTYPPLPTFEYDGVTVGAVAISGRHTGRSSALISIHEFGHLLGFADLYNEAGTTTDFPYSVMGGWYYDTAPTLLDPFSRGMIGWANVREVSGHETITIRPARDGGPVLKLGTGDEYFLAEYRTRSNDLEGDLTIPGGVVVERVRLSKLPNPTAGRFLGTLAHCVNCAAWDGLTMVEEADGHYDLQARGARDDGADLFLAGSAIAPSSDTAPRNATHPVFSTNLLSGAPTGTSLRVVELHPDHAVVEVEAPVVANTCQDLNRHLCRDLSCTNGYCGDAVVPPPPTDAGTPDTGVVDAGPLDAGARDAAARDAAGAPDAASPDRAEPEDGGLVDTGRPDTGAEVTADTGSPDAGAAEDSGSERPIAADTSGGCTCAAPSPARPSASLLLLAGLVALTRRRRRA